MKYHTRYNCKKIIYEGSVFENYMHLSVVIGISAQAIGQAVKLGHKIKGSHEYKLI